MAAEGSLVVSLTFAKGNITSLTRTSGTKTFDVAGTHFMFNVQEVGFAAAEALLLGDVATPGYTLMHNTDTTNYVTVQDQVAGGVNVVKLKAGEWALFRFAATAPAVKADTASVKLEYWLLED